MRYEGKIWEQKRPNQYDKFLGNSGNKISLEKYLLNDWNKKQVSTFQGKENDTTFDNNGFHIFEKNSIIQMQELYGISSDLEDTDKKMFLCAKYCATLGASWVFIHTVDRDLVVLLFYYSEHENGQFLTVDLLTSWKQNVDWTYIRRSEDTLNVSQKSIVIPQIKIIENNITCVSYSSFWAFFWNNSCWN